MNTAQLQAQLERVVQQGGKQGPPLGLFTMDWRENWAQAYKQLVKGKHFDKKHLSNIIR